MSHMTDREEGELDDDPPVNHKSETVIDPYLPALWSHNNSVGFSHSYSFPIQSPPSPPPPPPPLPQLHYDPYVIHQPYDPSVVFPATHARYHHPPPPPPPIRPRHPMRRSSQVPRPSRRGGRRKPRSRMAPPPPPTTTITGVSDSASSTSSTSLSDSDEELRIEEEKRAEEARKQQKEREDAMRKRLLEKRKKKNELKRAATHSPSVDGGNPKKAARIVVKTESSQERRVSKVVLSPALPSTGRHVARIRSHGDGFFDTSLKITTESDEEEDDDDNDDDEGSIDEGERALQSAIKAGKAKSLEKDMDTLKFVLECTKNQLELEKQRSFKSGQQRRRQRVVRVSPLPSRSPSPSPPQPTRQPIRQPTRQPTRPRPPTTIASSSSHSPSSLLPLQQQPPPAPPPQMSSRRFASSSTVSSGVVTPESNNDISLRQSVAKRLVARKAARLITDEKLVAIKAIEEKMRGFESKVRAHRQDFQSAEKKTKDLQLKLLQIERLLSKARSDMDIAKSKERANLQLLNREREALERQRKLYESNKREVERFRRKVMSRIRRRYSKKSRFKATRKHLRLLGKQRTTPGAKDQEIVRVLNIGELLERIACVANYTQELSAIRAELVSVLNDDSTSIDDDEEYAHLDDMRGAIVNDDEVNMDTKQAFVLGMNDNGSNMSGGDYNMCGGDYSSVLRTFRAHFLRDSVSMSGVRSLSRGSLVNPNQTFCRNELNNKCTDVHCMYQHFRDIEPSTSQIFNDLLSYYGDAHGKLGNFTSITQRDVGSVLPQLMQSLHSEDSRSIVERTTGELRRREVEAWQSARNANKTIVVRYSEPHGAKKMANGKSPHHALASAHKELRSASQFGEKLALKFDMKVAMEAASDEYNNDGDFIFLEDDDDAMNKRETDVDDEDGDDDIDDDDDDDDDDDIMSFTDVHEEASVFSDVLASLQKDYDVFLKRHPTCVSAWLRYAYLFVNSDGSYKYEDAMTDQARVWKRALEETRQNHESLHLVYAKHLAQTIPEYSVAVKRIQQQLESAVSCCPHSVNIHIEHARSCQTYYERLNSLQQAIDGFDEKHMSTSVRQLIVELVRTHIESGQLNRASQVLLHAIEQRQVPTYFLNGASAVPCNNLSPDDTVVLWLWRVNVSCLAIISCDLLEQQQYDFIFHDTSLLGVCAGDVLRSWHARGDVIRGYWRRTISCIHSDSALANFISTVRAWFIQATYQWMDCIDAEEASDIPSSSMMLLLCKHWLEIEGAAAVACENSRLRAVSCAHGTLLRMLVRLSHKLPLHHMIWLGPSKLGPVCQLYYGQSVDDFYVSAVDEGLIEQPIAWMKLTLTCRQSPDFRQKSIDNIVNHCNVVCSDAVGGSSVYMSSDECIEFLQHCLGVYRSTSVKHKSVSYGEYQNSVLSWIEYGLMMLYVRNSDAGFKAALVSSLDDVESRSLIWLEYVWNMCVNSVRVDENEWKLCFRRYLSWFQSVVHFHVPHVNVSPKQLESDLRLKDSEVSELWRPFHFCGLPDGGGGVWPCSVVFNKYRTFNTIVAVYMAKERSKSERLATLRELTKRFSGNTYVLVEYVMSALAHRDFGAARQCTLKLAHKFPRQWNFWAALTFLELTTGNSYRALQRVEEALNYCPTSSLLGLQVVLLSQVWKSESVKELLHHFHEAHIRVDTDNGNDLFQFRQVN